NAQVDYLPASCFQGTYLLQFLREVVLIYLCKSFCLYHFLLFLYSPNIFSSSVRTFIMPMAFWYSSYFSKVTSTKKEYFHGVSTMGSDWIFDRFRLQSLRMLRTEARLP